MKKTRFNSKAFKNIDQQKGWTLWSLLFVAGVLILFTYIGFQLVPVYTSNESVKKAMQQALDNVSGSNVNRTAVIRTLDNQLNLDGILGIIDYKTDLEVKRTQRELFIRVNYQRSVDLFYNLSLVATFENEVKKDL